MLEPTLSAWSIIVALFNASSCLRSLFRSEGRFAISMPVVLLVLVSIPD